MARPTVAEARERVANGPRSEMFTDEQRVSMIAGRKAVEADAAHRYCRADYCDLDDVECPKAESAQEGAN